ncbi:OprD family porin [Pseudomonas sp. MAG002Y]|uniref:OprD family porin n=1 Tax=Pseudomonas TaxID=286 RepID=UPI001C60EC06|nr:OprD family porin [Pseudomonas sp. MAG002Y]MBW5412290.1 outer membrane porin, OprD family [Pseudomonas sp. MAG002Y]
MGKKPLALAVASACLSLYAFSSAQAAGFVEDSKATLSMRNFYINTDNRNGTNNPSKVEEWGQGFMLNYQSGFTEGTVGFGVDAVGMLGLRLDGGGRLGKSTAERQPSASGSFPLDTDGSYENEFSSLGLTAKAKISKTELRYGTLSPKLPVVTINDGRLLPQTFQGGQVTSKEIDGVTFIAGQLEHTKTRGSSSSESFSIGGSNSGRTARDSNQFRFAGADYAVTKDLTLQYYFGQLEDFYNQHFLGLGHSVKLGDGTFKTDLRYFNSKGNGNNKDADTQTALYGSTGYYGSGRTRGKVDNQLYSALFAYTISGHTVAAGYQITNGDSDFPFINTGEGASAYINTDSQIAKFNRAGEDTWQVRYAYDFATVGVPGLTAGVTYLNADNARHSTGDKSEWERDISVAYVIPQGTFKGLGLTWKNAVYRSEFPGQRDQDENRLIVSYSLPLL